MTNCTNCNAKLSIITKTEVNNLNHQLSMRKDYNLTKNYNHVYFVCQNCFMVQDTFGENELQIINNNKTELQKVFDNKLLHSLELGKFVVSAEVAAYNYELISNHEKAAFAYKAATDILEVVINNFVLLKKDINTILNEDIKNNALSDNAEQLNKLNNYNMFLKSLALGHSLECAKSNNALLVYNIISLDLDLLDIENATKTLHAISNKVDTKSTEHQNIIALLNSKIKDTLNAITINFDMDKISE